MISSTATLTLFRAIFALEFRDLTQNDRHAFMDAQADAQIAFAGSEIACAITLINGHDVMDEGNNIAVIVSGSVAEIHYMDPEGDAYTIQIDLTFGC